MENIKPGKLFLLLLAGLLVFLLFFFIPVKSSWVKFPILKDFVSQDVVVIPIEPGSGTYYASVNELDTVSLGSDGERNKKVELMGHEKLIHATDFENEMAPFYKALSKLKDNDTLLRILHFGDSQIEGDRISGVVRNQMQTRFGGCGIGYVPISETRVHRLNVRKVVKGWNKYKLFGQMQKGRHNGYGFTGYFHTIQAKTGKASIKMSGNKKYFKRSQKFDKVSLMYSSPTKNFPVAIAKDKSDWNILNVSKGEVQKKSWLLNNTTASSAHLTLSNSDSIDVYGVALDCQSGVALDNVAMRGSSGTEFTKTNKDVFKKQLQLMNVGLIIYQYGVNVVPSVLKDYKFYENMVYTQLKMLRSIAPNAAILVIGVSDMARKDGGAYVSYPNIEKVKLAQKKAAKRAGCAFWDLHAVMGGPNSINEWVAADPPLAEKDYTHFSLRGGQLIGEKLFQAILQDYQSYTTSGFN